ncbi:hypothetical protein TWF191_002816 [Orbilia oligospora]|uniref:Uncharacterized protein n=1 Tax=Orbilia oligospora TaxID=2813651 RepID=A0A7C8UJG6_ORBOL|nr:hypothetical protein TWF679_001046 [Orbilia oligospora]KAF3203031.1 hypothetical protein TWF191_002816 [Orbilia oligospora]
MPDFTTSQIRDTDPSPYDQIFLVTQDTINKTFKNMWALADQSSPLVKFNYKSHGQYLTGDPDAPEIELSIYGQNSVQLYYHLKFLTGQMELYIDPNSDDTKDFSLVGWDIVFPVVIGSETYKPGDPGYDEHAAKFSKDGFPNGTFSIAKLFLAASSISGGATFDAKRSSFGGLDWDNQPGELKENFGMFISKWINTMSDKKENILGYSIVGNDPSQINGAAPTFVPTSIDHYNYPWVEPGYSSTSGQDGLDQNAFCYLTMADFRKPPEIAGLTYSGPFVNKDNGATFCMNSNIFWDTWLLPLLQELNMQTLVYPETPYLKFANDSGTTLTFDEGGQKISVVGKNQFHFEFHDEASWGGGSGGFTATTDWHLNFALGAVNDGGLQITRIPDPDGVPASTTTGTQFIYGFYHEENFVNYCKGVDDALSYYFDNNISTVTNSLISALQNQNQLVLPGNGVFLMEDARFNKRGDLLVDLHYNGAPAPPSPHQPNKEHNLYAGFVENPNGGVPENQKWLPEKWAKLPARATLSPVKPKELSQSQKIKATIPRG